MANPGYVRSTDGDNADDGSTWALANATLAGGFTDASAGNRIFLSDNHAETQASAMTLTSPGALASPCEVLAGDDAAEPPTALATTATISTTGNSAITITGSASYYGITFSCASGGFGDIGVNVNNLNNSSLFEECVFVLANTSTLSDLMLGGTGAQSGSNRIEFRNTDVQFGAAGQGIDLGQCRFLWTGGTILGTAPTSLFTPADSNTAVILAELNGVDLSPLGTNAVLALNNANVRMKLEQCKLASGAVFTSGSWAHDAGYMLVINCDSADTNYRYYRSSYRGEIFHETTVVRTGGASDGTTAFSRKMVTSANAKFVKALVYGDAEDPLLVWNEITGSSVTVTVEVVTDNVTLTDAEAWIEVEYLGTSGFPLALFASDRAADILATPANQTSSSETWTTTGLTTPVKQKLSVSFTPQEKGWIQVRVMLAKASTTAYFCPKVDVS